MLVLPHKPTEVRKLEPTAVLVPSVRRKRQALVVADIASMRVALSELQYSRCQTFWHEGPLLWIALVAIVRLEEGAVVGHWSSEAIDGLGDLLADSGVGSDGPALAPKLILVAVKDYLEVHAQCVVPCLHLVIQILTAGMGRREQVRHRL